MFPTPHQLRRTLGQGETMRQVIVTEFLTLDGVLEDLDT